MGEMKGGKKEGREHKDISWREILSERNFLRQFIREFLPDLSQVMEEVKWEKARRETETFTSGTFGRLVPDLVWRLPLASEEECFLFLLIEHQTSSPRYMAYKILLYMTAILERAVRQLGLLRPGKRKFRLPGIVPVVFYLGPGRWKAPQRLSKLMVEGPHPKDFLEARYLLVDLSELEEEALVKQGVGLPLCCSLRRGGICRSALTGSGFGPWPLRPWLKKRTGSSLIFAITWPVTFFWGRTQTRLTLTRSMRYGRRE